MNFGFSGIDELNGLDNALIEEIEKETKGAGDNKRKFDIYDEYELLLNKKKKKKKNEHLEKNASLAAKANLEQQTTLINSITGSPFNREFQNYYIFNDYRFVREYVYKNNLTSDDIFFKAEQLESRCRTECAKLASTNEDIDEYLKIYDCNDIYPPVYVKKLGCQGKHVGRNYMPNLGDDTQEQQQGGGTWMTTSFLKRNKEEFRITLEKVLKEIKEEDQKRKENRENKPTELGGVYQDEETMGKTVRPQTSISFVEKYRAKYFSELLTDETINREVLLWMKQWTERIAKGSANMASTQGNDKNEEEENKKSSEFQRILLLGGSAGKGKTTLAYVIANHFKFNVIEINGSDDRNKETLIPLLESIVCNNSIGSKPNMCIIDEIDGMTSTQQNIEAVMKFLTKKDRRNRSIIKRPIICICNDIYHKSLKELRKISKVVVVDSVNYETLKGRIHFICDREGISIGNDTVSKLVEICKGDIRAILNTVCFLSIGGGSTSNGGTNGSASVIGQRTHKQRRKVVITMDLLNAYLFYKDANNNYMELLNMIYVKNKNKKMIKQLLQECYQFFHLNLSNEYNYLQTYYYVYDNLMNIPFNDFDFCKLSYSLDFLSFCDNMEYRQKQNFNYSMHKMLFYAVYLFILIIHLNINSHVQYILVHNSHSNYNRTKQLSVKQIKENFLNEKFGAITYKYIYSKQFFFETINYIFSFFYMNEFFYRNVHLWGTASYFNDLDAPKYSLVPYHFNNVNKLKLFCLKLLHVMTLFNISFTNVSMSSSSLGPFHFGPHRGNQPFRGAPAGGNPTGGNHVGMNNASGNHVDGNHVRMNNASGNHVGGNRSSLGEADKVYVFDPYVDDFLLYAEKKETGYRQFHQIGKPPMATSTMLTPHANTFHFQTLDNLLNNTVCEKLNQLKKWINNQSVYYSDKKKQPNQMHIIKASSSKTNKGKFEVNYSPNFDKSLTDIILIAQQKGYQKAFSIYFPNELAEDGGVGFTSGKLDAKTGSTDKQAKGGGANAFALVSGAKNFKNEQNILKTKILHNTGDAALTIADLIKEEKIYMDRNINKDKKIYFTGKYVKTKGYYKNIEERCNAVLQPLHFCVFQGN
ncbi:replication factor c protein, putative [Plasmodium knowlesi strain H]|uniref:P-loop containing nucleoside triphosphate hydrolase, putative n=3 Tax=Plasmodium knowlesi TaxID=5850 RepID=B3KZG1_PLAKH|nr:P-loop containing nucleoside triphosphate hydrolase, putative [Plasmodium knowlesi strain H]OTN66172.1 putative Replication factor c protein [Plasmodium knowlesi]CAA9986288.1 P-loop containing nucleoside triphosphate hydrolase, putative [Plasmodium knowlesi strain H]SBO25510.1 replication factor c protein, putative [Plasmodium knowlesi strain H]VVS75762.1 P-loop containing nucleoside triphosphate hydrolase, putative [Plasmodium knowlesi strain H]|eukprot:XP_002257693.1 replication factor c protein, putative [Plasmodium knowlesi strain H]